MYLGIYHFTLLEMTERASLIITTPGKPVIKDRFMIANIII
jgi:hypothetical protein